MPAEELDRALGASYRLHSCSAGDRGGPLTAAERCHVGVRVRNVTELRSDGLTVATRGSSDEVDA